MDRNIAIIGGYLLCAIVVIALVDAPKDMAMIINPIITGIFGVVVGQAIGKKEG